MIDDNVRDDDRSIRMLLSYLGQHGLLLCNDNTNLPSLSQIGGDWNSIITLIERGEVFYSKLFKGRVTYLSRDFYYQVKPYKQRVAKLSAQSREVFEFVKNTEPVTTQEIKQLLALPQKIYDQCMTELCKELLVTATQRDKIINVSWSSFLWGTYSFWEQIKPSERIEPELSRINDLLSGLLTEKQVQHLLK